MRNRSERFLVTGAAGFIGSHLTDRLLTLGFRVTGLDNLSTGRRSNLAHALKNPNFQFVEGDLLNIEAVSRALGNYALVFHLAANAEVRAGEENPRTHFEQNLLATFNLLEAIRKRKLPTRFVFASTSTIYGEPSLIPTPESYGPLLPISMYGATKLGCEALATSYTQLLPFQVVVFRFANVVGPRAGHGVVYDFISKLERNPQELEVLGDGTQTKSYFYIDDCIDAFLLAVEDRFWQIPVEVYNIGSEDQTNVLRIGHLVAEAMGLGKVHIRTLEGVDGRAWPGDIKTMLLDISKIEKHGWLPKRNSEQAVRQAATELLKDLSAKHRISGG
jgi:UDP-glucose 4-epimerase